MNNGGSQFKVLLGASLHVFRWLGQHVVVEDVDSIDDVIIEALLFHLGAEK